MATAAPMRTPMHLWIVGVLSLLWNAYGSLDYLMTRMRNTDWLAAHMPGVDPSAALTYFDSMPLYAQIGWGLGVWSALVGAVLLLMRNRYAVWAFGLSLVGMALSFGYIFLIGPPMPGSEEAGMMEYMPLLIVILGIAQFAYARAAEKKGLLH